MLVVEDEPLVRLLIIDVLEELGYKALEASDGPAGLRILQSPQRIDLLITDIGLPGLNGRQVADAARVTRPDLKVLFMTGYAENAAHRQRRAGARHADDHQAVCDGRLRQAHSRAHGRWLNREERPHRVRLGPRQM